MFDAEPVDEPPQGRLRGKGCLILAATSVAAVFAGIAIIAVVGAALFPPPKRTGPDPTMHPAVGRTLPVLELEPLEATDPPVTLDDLRGKVILLNFWGTWCQPCWEEIPELAALRRKLRDRQDFRLLTVSCGYQMPEDPEMLRRDTEIFLAELKLDVPTYIDPDGATRQALASLGPFGGLPFTAVMDRHGVIRGIWVGFGPQVPIEVEQFVFRLLDGQP